MRVGKQLSFIFFFIFLCIAPILVYGQDTSRLIDFPNIEGDTKLQMTEAIRKGLGDVGHLVFNEDEMIEAAKAVGQLPGYWSSEQNIAAVNKKVRHDAVVVIEQIVGKKIKLYVKVYNAYTGEMIQDMERVIKKKGKVTKQDVQAIAKAVTALVSEIDSSQYPLEIEFNITSVPSGAAIIKDGTEIGKTPYVYVTVANPGVTEQWTLIHPDRDPQTLIVSYDGSNNYHLVFPEPAPKNVEPEKLENGFGRPIVMVVANATPTIRKVSLGGKFTYDRDEWTFNDFSHRQPVYPILGLGLEFFPCPLFSTVDYLQGLGIRLGFGFGFGKKGFEFKDSKGNRLALTPEQIKCQQVGDGEYKCATNDIRFNVDLVYRLLLQKKEDGMLDPNGMSLEFFLGFNMIKYSFDKNPTYMGQDYNGLRVGAGYSTALGLPALRLDLNVALLANFGNDGAQKLALLGNDSRQKSIGVQANVDFKFDVWKGLFLHAGYGLDMIKNDYHVSCGKNVAECSSSNVMKLTDMFHRIMLGIGYAYY